MTKWLQRHEKVLKHINFIVWHLSGGLNTVSASPSLEHKLHIHIAHHPNIKGVSFQTLSSCYGAADFEFKLASLILKLCNPMLMAQQLRWQAEQTTLPFHSVVIYYRVKFWNTDAQGHDQVLEMLNSAHTHPEITMPNGQQLLA